MRCLPLMPVVALSCVSTSVARLSPATYEPRSEQAPIPLYSAQLPTCAFKEIAIVKARRETWMVSADAAVDALRKKARSMGGDALVRVGFGPGREITGTVIRFEREDCTQ